MENAENISGSSRLRQRLVQVAYVVAIAAGAKLGYDFGDQVSGRLLGIIGAINGALFCWLMVGMMAERVLRSKASSSDR